MNLTPMKEKNPRPFLTPFYPYVILELHLDQEGLRWYHFTRRDVLINIIYSF